MLVFSCELVAYTIALNCILSWHLLEIDLNLTIYIIQVISAVLNYSALTSYSSQRNY